MSRAAVRELQRYLAVRAAVRPLNGDVETAAQCRCAIVIPARAESVSLPVTLASIARNARRVLDETLVVVVVNNPDPARVPEEYRKSVEADAADNRRLLEWLRDGVPDGLHVVWIDCASPGQEFPPTRGVGLARKIGCDSVLRLFYEKAVQTGADLPDPHEIVLLSLDADTTVAPTWLEKAVDAVHSLNAPGGLCRFHHVLPADPTHRNAVCAYELYMRYYLEALREAGSPYAFAAIGSAVVCSARGYYRAGGFPASRLAGEDFYFVQQLARVGGVLQFIPAIVRPSARLSHRVPFGTGPAVRRILQHGVDRYMVFAPEAFAVVRGVIAAAAQAVTKNPEILPTTLPPEARHFFQRRGFSGVWQRFRKQFRAPDALLAAFHEWFDGLATLQLLRELTATCIPPVPLLDAVGRIPSFARIPRIRNANLPEILAAARLVQERRCERLGPRSIYRDA